MNADRHTDRQTDIQRDIQTDIQADIQANIHTDIKLKKIWLLSDLKKNKLNGSYIFVSKLGSSFFTN